MNVIPTFIYLYQLYHVYQLYPQEFFSQTKLYSFDAHKEQKTNTGQAILTEPREAQWHD